MRASCDDDHEPVGRTAALASTDQIVVLRRIAKEAGVEPDECYCVGASCPGAWTSRISRASLESADESRQTEAVRAYRRSLKRRR